jgi:hypothetical protein
MIHRDDMIFFDIYPNTIGCFYKNEKFYSFKSFHSTNSIPEVVLERYIETIYMKEKQKDGRK